METEIDYYDSGSVPSKRKIFTPSQLNRGIRQLLEANFLNICVEGEISNFKLHSSGHMYFSLKDEKSQISAVFFAGQNRSTRFQIKDGLKVLIFGKISVYEPRGSYQIYVERVEPKGIGELQLAFQQLREKLEKEGLFEASRKKSIPEFPKTVGVVTSLTGAAFRDILNVMNRRFSGTAIVLNPVQVQGDGAAAQIARAIREFNQLGGIDVMIVGRGGGSIEDLWAFNEEVVARAVYESKIPVISAVGHEIDWTICDFVADLRAPTPSAAAELVVQNRQDLVKRVTESQTRLLNRMHGILEEKYVRLEQLKGSYAFKQPQVLIEQFSQRLDEMLRQLQNYMKSAYSENRQTFQALAGKLHALSPLAILERGYSISFSGSDKPLKDASKLKKGDTIKTLFLKSAVYSEVTRVAKEEGHERRN